jgi:hypothetical protein
VIKHIRGLAPILPADVVGFSSRIEKDEEGRRVPKRASVSSMCASAHRTKGQESTYTGIRSVGAINDP